MATDTRSITKKQRKHEHPCSYLWYGKHAYKPIEEVIDKWPDYFLWEVSEFLDVTVQQARYFKDKYGMELPAEVIAPAEVEPYEYTKGSPEGEYADVCKQYVETYWPDELQ